MKIFVAIPVYDGKLQHQTVNGLMLEQLVASRLGDEIFTSFLPYCSNLPDGRNALVDGFLKSKCDRMIFLDSDITFEAGALVKIAHAPVDFSAGCTRHKLETESYPIMFQDKDMLVAEPNGLLEIDSIGTAFMSLSRDVFTKFKAFYPERGYTHYGINSYCYFQAPFVDGSLYGEDTHFCKSWRDSGGQIWLNPELEITHWDLKTPYVGHIGKWLRARMENVNEQSTQSELGRTGIHSPLEASRDQEISAG